MLALMLAAVRAIKEVGNDRQRLRQTYPVEFYAVAGRVWLCHDRG